MSGADFVWTTPMIVGVVVLGLFEFGLMLWAVVDWVKRPPAQIRGNRILWLLLILLVNIAGPIIYLTVGRLPAAIDDSQVVASPEASQAATDVLYGDSDRSIIS
ncbi:MAG: PLDc N-terminal domain-containing protein [Coriobacteriia bacterium]|nr:PLDc N-terminal domain-containing protein [Coriobacteriia bacterium]